MSTTPRIFVKSDLVAGAPLALTAEQANYLFRVLRKQKGDEVRVFNGRDGEWASTIREVMRSAGFLELVRQVRPQEHISDLHLLFAPLKKTRTDFVVEKATELGVAIIQPVITQRTQTVTVRTSRLTSLAQEAAEQTERLDAPSVEEPIQLLQAIGEWREERKLIFCDEAGDQDGEPWGGEEGRAVPIFEAIRNLSDGPAAILVGPEGGFTPEERQRLREQSFTIPVSLGPRILRAETAVVAALAVWQAVRGDWKSGS